MKHGARNTVSARVASIKKGDIMSLVRFEVSVPAEMSSVLTTESLEELGIKVGDELKLAIKAVHVLPYRE
ncbi:MAG: TOBE domain-containing protein [Spirochaetes bacterium]|jgi:molybdate transport system regulatory protein|nr:TOBE domain-containing protein [Spirochaetota bacterium]